VYIRPILRRKRSGPVIRHKGVIKHEEREDSESKQRLGEFDWLTQRTIIPGDFTIRTTALISQPTDPTDVILILIVVIVDPATGIVTGA